MADRRAVLQAAIAKNEQYLINKGALAIYRKIEAYKSELETIDANDPALKTMAGDPVAAQEWTGTFEQALARFLDGEDKLLEAAGKPFGRNGEPRGALDRDTHIKLATELGVLDELGGPDFFGPATPGASL